MVRSIKTEGVTKEEAKYLLFKCTKFLSLITPTKSSSMAENRARSSNDVFKYLVIKSIKPNGEKKGN